MELVRYDQGLSELIESEEVERIARGHLFTEGPVWHPDGYLLYSDIPADRIYIWTDEGTKTYRHPSGQSNGLAIDPAGRLLACEHANRRVSRTELDGARISLADRYQRKRLNSPNDLAIHSDGSVYFTDPPYGVRAEERELEFQGVYRIRPDMTLELVVVELGKPNGLAFSPDESLLYVDDSATGDVWAFELGRDGPAQRKLVARIESPMPGSVDGMSVDREGRLYVTGPEGVWVFSPTGQRLGVISIPEKPSNCCWGEPDRQTLFVTARSSVYRIRMRVSGGSRP